MNNTKALPVGVVLMSFGSPATLEDVPAYMASVRGGRPAAGELVTEFQRRYRVVGGSPLIRITLEQASALEVSLNAEAGKKGSYRVVVGMRHAPPLISEALTKLASEGIKRVIAIILSPQYSPIIMGGYHRAVEEASSVLGPYATVRVAGAWHQLPSFLDALAQRVSEALDRFSPQEREEVPVLLTAHSLPKSVVDREPGHIDQLKETAIAVAKRVGLSPDRWWFAYQSAGHTSEEWLKPDLKDLFPSLKAAGHPRVLVVPIQFLADHLEILYDIDIAARDEAEAVGLDLVRIESFNAMPEFIRALADVVHREMALQV
ncbi:MAG: ferrochelatase [Chloroflexi bacterium]|nr:ferrochelatase [Chloroflexota bacterium]